MALTSSPHRPPPPSRADFSRWVRTAAEQAVRACPPAESGRVDRPLLQALAEQGLCQAVFGPDSSGASAVELCLLRESAARVSPAAETALALQGLGAYPVLQSGTPEQVDAWIPEVAAGRAVAAFALTEPGAGSDAAALALEARPAAGGGWTLHGTKTWISNAPDADVYTVFARTGPDPGARGVTAFLVPGDRPGLSGQPLDMLGGHALGTLEFDGVPVGPGDVLGAPGSGFRTAMRTLDLFRPSVGAFAVGMAQTALDAALDHTAGRRAFGGPLRDRQSVAHLLADMSTRTETARMLVYRAAEARDAAQDSETAGDGGPGATELAAMAKLAATEAAQSVVDTAVQLHGARALERGHPLEHLYREVRAPRIYEGASEVQRDIIARALFRRADARRAPGAGGPPR
ncbi:acyl-CoA dehydrogenase family protein [Nocardiopsis coralliicola]